MRRNLQSRRRNSKAVEGPTMPLAAYRSKRAFTETPEPVGQVRRSGRRRGFVVKKHDATRLHYDFRLAVNGVLASWAVPKGPSMNPADKRLAVRTEDHPLQYGKFEGVIPYGQYGAGTVMVWDLGNYQPLEDQPPEEQLASGKIHILLLGEKLRGGFSLVQIQRRSMNSSRRDHGCLSKVATSMRVRHGTSRARVSIGPSLLAAV